ncbi:hypothetical protein D5018_16920, partial [Parashewanella curva]
VFPPDTAKEWFYSAELEKTYEEKREEGGGPYWQNNGKLALLMNSMGKMIFEAFSQSRTTLEDMHVDRPLANACAYNALFGATVKNETAEKTDTSLRRQIIAAANNIAQHPSVKDQPQQLLTLMYATGCDLTLTDSIPESTAVPTEQTAATQAANPMAQFVQAMMSAASSVTPNPTTTTATGPTYTRKPAQQHVLPRPQPTRQVQTDSIYKTEPYIRNQFKTVTSRLTNALARNLPLYAPLFQNTYLVSDLRKQALMKRSLSSDYENALHTVNEIQRHIDGENPAQALIDLIDILRGDSSLDGVSERLQVIFDQAIRFD